MAVRRRKSMASRSGEGQVKRMWRDTGRTRMSVDRAVWLTWWIGTILIVLSWMQVVSNEIGWAGFGISAASFFLHVLGRRSWKIPHQDESHDNLASKDSETVE